MDFITSFDIRLEKDVYYPGEPVLGCVVLENSEPIKVRGIRAFLRGRARVQWKVLKSGESRTLKDDQYLLDEKTTIWGKEKPDDPESDGVQILPKGLHQFNFNFQLPQCQMPCSMETKAGTIRYYVKVIIDIPYASSPQGIKYFTLIGPHTDCMEDKYMAPLSGADHKVRCFRCCRRGTIALRLVLERSAYCCGEKLRLKAHIENRQDFTVGLCIRLFQHIEYRIDRGAGEVKSVVSTVLEYRSPNVAANAQQKFDSSQDQLPIKIPVVPPTTVGVCRIMQVYYILKACIEDERKNETLEMDFPLTIGTIPYRSSHAQVYSVTYDFCSEDVETGRNISPEFRLGHVYDGNGNAEEAEDVILYRPVYVKVVDKAPNAGKLTRDILDSQISDSPLSIRKTTKNGSQKSVNTLLQSTPSSPKIHPKAEENGALEHTKLI
ncbi:Protein ARRD-6 a [Aphelenchoides avenae]|nr:Protein ARRD-6 a [Aphelenchus avenae]